MGMDPEANRRLTRNLLWKRRDHLLQEKGRSNEMTEGRVIGTCQHIPALSSHSLLFLQADSNHRDGRPLEPLEHTYTE